MASINNRSGDCISNRQYHCSRFNDLPTDKQDYTTFVSIANSVGSEPLPSKPRPPSKTVDTDPVVTARKATLRVSTRKIQTTLNNLRATFDSLEDKCINDTLQTFENLASPAAIKNALNLVKEVSRKQTRSVIFIEGEDRLNTWENHFKNLLNAPPTAESEIRIEKIYDTFNDIQSGEFSQAEVDAAVHQTKKGKSPGRTR